MIGRKKTPSQDNLERQARSAIRRLATHYGIDAGSKLAAREYYALVTPDSPVRKTVIERRKELGYES